MQRSVLVAGALVLALALVACGKSDERVRSDHPDDGPSTTTSTPPSTPGNPVDPDQVVWQETSGGGFVPASSVAAEVPAVTIYADGRVLRVVTDAKRAYDHPAALELSRVEPDALQAFLERARSSGLFDADADYGSPGVTDMATTSATLLVGPTPRTVDVYALGFDAPSSQHGEFGISAEQAQMRKALTKLLGEAAELGGSATAYVPDRVRATAFTGPEGGPEGGPGPLAWPGPAFDQFPAASEGSGTACLVIEDDQATAVYDAAIANDGIRWVDGSGTERSVVVAPLVPGQEGCPPA